MSVQGDGSVSLASLIRRAVQNLNHVVSTGVVTWDLVPEVSPGLEFKAAAITASFSTGLREHVE